MAVMYIKDKNDRWNKIDVGRMPAVTIHFDYGGCTGDTLCIDMDQLWLADGDNINVSRSISDTTEEGTVKINGEEVE